MYLKSAMNLNQTLILAIKCQNAIKIHFHMPLIPFYTFFDKNCAWISWDFLVQKNLLITLGYHKNYFGSTVFNMFELSSTPSVLLVTVYSYRSSMLQYSGKL